MASFQPLVPGILPTEWYISESKAGKGRDLWEMWHIYYTHQHYLYTVLLNSLDEGLLAVNSHKKGLHVSQEGLGSGIKSVCTGGMINHQPAQVWAGWFRRSVVVFALVI